MKTKGEPELRCATETEVLGDRKGALVPRKWSKHYHRLLSLRLRLQCERAGLKEQASTELPVHQLHFAEAASDEFDHDLAWSLLAAEQDALAEVEAALRRIERGSYGICELTGKAIPRQRLEVIPWTRFSADAEKQLEAAGAVQSPHIEQAQSISGENNIRETTGPGEIDPPDQAGKKSMMAAEVEQREEFDNEEPTEQP